MKPGTTRVIVSVVCLAGGLACGWLVRQNTARSAVAAAKPLPRPAAPRHGPGSGNAAKNADAPLKEEPAKSMVSVIRASDFRLAARIAALSPEQARRHLAAGFAARNFWLAELLWFRAALDDPAGMLAQRKVPGVDRSQGRPAKPKHPCTASSARGCAAMPPPPWRPRSPHPSARRFLSRNGRHTIPRAPHLPWRAGRFPSNTPLQVG